MKKKSPVALIAIVIVLIGALAAIGKFVAAHTPVDEDEAEHSQAH